MNGEVRSEEEVAALLQHADVMLMQADFVAEAEERRKLLADAKDALLRAEMLAAGAGAWRLARIAAKLAQDDLCHKWLLRAQAHGRLPTVEALASDPGFRSVREKPWFRRLVGKSRRAGA